MKTIKDAVIELDGVLPKEVVFSGGAIFQSGSGYLLNSGHLFYAELLGYSRTEICTREQFEACAKRLGYISGYRWGVEYPTNGKRPDLPDDVCIKVKHKDSKAWSFNSESSNDCWRWSGTESFMVTDRRYKPADEVSGIAESINKAEYVSELRDNKPFDRKVSGFVKAAADKIVEELISIGRSENNWHDRGELPPVGAQVAVTLDKRDRPAEVCGAFCEYVWVRYEDEAMPDTVHKMYIRPIRTEREKVIEAAAKEFHKNCMVDYSGQPFLDGLASLYNAGMLVLTPKKSDTED